MTCQPGFYLADDEVELFIRREGSCHQLDGFGVTGRVLLRVAGLGWNNEGLGQRVAYRSVGVAGLNPGIQLVGKIDDLLA